MSTTERGPAKIHINGFHFTDKTLPPNQAMSGNAAGPMHNMATNDLPAYERMANDKIGKELAPDAAIWKLYLEEADEYDKELVEGRQKSLDTLLLFAALFSAILTVFLIESKNMLQEDPQSTSSALLLLMAQSQYRIERGLPAPESDILPTLSTFKPSKIARAINGIWFASLGLSLTAALIAMLGKEWLTAYLASRPRAPRTHALLRQARYEGLQRWWALHIVAFLPSLLHASLLLFSIGLVIYLWGLDEAVAAILAGIVATTLIFYVLTAVLGAVYQYCPFVTEISKYVHRAIARLLRCPELHQTPPSKDPSQEDLRAILWLANNARDPDIVKCSYQALSGFRPRLKAELPGATSTSSHNREHLSAQGSEISTWIDPAVDVTALLVNLTDGYSQATTDSLHNRFPSLSVRYLNALIGVYDQIMRMPAEKMLAAQSAFAAAANAHNGFETNTTMSPFRILDLIDSTWVNNTRSFSSTYYVDLMNAEHGAMMLAAAYLDNNLGVANHPSTEHPSVRFKRLHASSSASYTVNMLHTGPESQPELSDDLPHLRAQYSRWLARFSVLVNAHSINEVQIEARPLRQLLYCLSQAARCIVLNPEGSISTGFPQPTHPSVGTYNLGVMRNTTSILVHTRGLWRGPMAMLLELMVKLVSGTNREIVPLCSAAISAFAALAPVLLQQETGLDRSKLVDAFDSASKPTWKTKNLSVVRYTCMRQVLLLLRFTAESETTTASHWQLCEGALELGRTCLEADQHSSDRGSYQILARSFHEVEILLRLVQKSERHMNLLTPPIKERLIHWAVTRHTVESGMDNGFTLHPESFITLISFIETRMCLGDYDLHDPHLKCNTLPPIEFLYPFTRSSRGFAELASASSHRRYNRRVLGAIIDITHLAAGRNPKLAVDPVELRAAAVPGFLDAVRLIFLNSTGTKERNRTVLSFIDDVLCLLSAAASSDEGSRELIKHHDARRILRNVLSTFRGGDEISGLMSRLVELTASVGSSMPAPKPKSRVAGTTYKRQRTTSETFAKPQRKETNASMEV